MRPTLATNGTEIQNGDTSDLTARATKGRLLFFPQESPIDASGIRHALNRRQADTTPVLVMPKATYPTPEGFRFLQSEDNSLEVYRAGWCRECKHRLWECECGDVQAGHHDPDELDFE